MTDKSTTSPTGNVPPPGESDEYYEHLLDAAQKASQDFDAWVLKLGTAGITLVTVVAALTDAANWNRLVLSGLGFSASLLAGLVSLRLSADGIRKLASGADYHEIKSFKVVTVLNWIAVVVLFAAYTFLVWHLADATILEEQR